MNLDRNRLGATDSTTGAGGRFTWNMVVVRSDPSHEAFVGQAAFRVGDMLDGYASSSRRTTFVPLKRSEAGR
jgi:hypothetical protein